MDKWAGKTGRKKVYKYDNGAAQIIIGIIVIISGIVLGIYLYREVMADSPLQKTLLTGSIVTILGTAICATGFFGMKRKSEWERLRLEGVRYDADIDDCVMTNRRNRVYTLTCRYTDGNGNARLCKSPALSYDPREYTPGKVIIYVDAGKPQNYFMDLNGSMAM